MDLSREIFWLVLTIGFTGLLWVPYIGNRLRELGPPGFSWFPPQDPAPKAEWAGRTVRAHENAIENLIIFAPLVIIIELTRSNSDETALACMGYFLSRVAHYVIGLSGAPIPFRTLAFLAGIGCQYTLVCLMLI